MATSVHSFTRPQTQDPAKIAKLLAVDSVGIKRTLNLGKATHEPTTQDSCLIQVKAVHWESYSGYLDWNISFKKSYIQNDISMMPLNAWKTQPLPPYLTLRQYAPLLRIPHPCPAITSDV